MGKMKSLHTPLALHEVEPLVGGRFPVMDSQCERGIEAAWATDGERRVVTNARTSRARTFFIVGCYNSNP